MCITLPQREKVVDAIARGAAFWGSIFAEVTSFRDGSQSSRQNSDVGPRVFFDNAAYQHQRRSTCAQKSTFCGNQSSTTIVGEIIEWFVAIDIHCRPVTTALLSYTYLDELQASVPVTNPFIKVECPCVPRWAKFSNKLLPTTRQLDVPC